MSSSYLPHAQHFTPHFTQQLPHHHHPISTPQPAYHIAADGTLWPNDASYQHTSALQQQQQLQHRHCMNDQFYTAHPDIRVAASTPNEWVPANIGRQDSGIAQIANGWQVHQTSMGVPATASHRPFKRARSHQRTPSASTVASTGPVSPYAQSPSYPQIANTDFSPNSPAQQYYADQAAFSKNLPTPQQTPTDSTFLNSASYLSNQGAPTPNAHLAMKGFAIDHHFADEIPPEYIHSARHSMSSHSNDTPATPQSGVGENYDIKNFINQSNVQLYRTESQAFQDELYNPGSTFSSVPAAAANPNSSFLTPHRNLINERLQTANAARTGSPAPSVSRERSPFRDGSPLAPPADWNNAQPVGTVSNMRRRQKEEAEQAEYAQHVPQLRREPTKTISPKDAMLDYTDTDQPSLFQENIPAGYRQHTADNETWQNGFVSQPGSTFGNLVATGSNPQMTPFRAASSDGYNEANMGFMPMSQNQQMQNPQMQGSSLQANSYGYPKMNYDDGNPGDFPAHLTSMESSVSENGPLPSSQDNYNISSAPQRPADTRAHTGTYTCTYHGCAQRFESHTSLQKHKRDFHRSQHREPTSDANTGETESPRSSGSPVDSTDGMTSAALQERNSQAGPHRCTRINPSTNKPCNTIFSRPYDLTRHEDTIHNNRKHKVKCPMCREDKTFSRNDALTRHMRVVHPEVESFGKRGRRD